MRVDWIKCSSETLDTVPKKAGQLIYVTDSKEQYFDVKNGERIKISDVIFLESIAARDSLEDPFTGKLYFISETRELWAYENNRWVDVELGTQAWKTIFDNSNVSSSAVNAQQALEELYNTKLNKVNTADIIYCNDSNGNVQPISKTSFVNNVEYNTFKDAITATVTNNMTTLQGEISDLRTYVDDEIATVDGKIDTIKDGVDEKIAQGDLAVKEELTDLIYDTKTDIETDYNDKIAIINTTIETVQQNITDLDDSKINKNISTTLSTGTTLTNEVEGILLTDNRINPTTNETSIVSTLLTSSDIDFETDVNGINLSIPELDTLDTKIDDNYTSLDSKITLLRTDYETNKSTVTDRLDGIDTSITTLEGSVTTNSTDIDNLENRADTIESNITEIQGNITDIQYDLSNVEAMHNFSEYPSIVSTNVSTVEMFNSIKALNLNAGTMLLGACRLTDFPEGLTNAEVQIMVYPNNVLFAVLRSSNLYPYEWIANSHSYNGWMSLSDNALTTAKNYTDTKTADISSIKTRLGTAENNIQTNSDDIDTLETNVSTNTQAISDLDDKYDTITSTLRTDVDTNTSNITTLTGRVTTNETNISNLQTQVETNTDDISDLKTDNTTNKSDISDLKSRMTTAETDIDNLESSVSTNTANIGSLTTRVTDTETDIGNINTDISSINDSITDIQGDITSINTNLTDLDTRVTTNTTNISTNTSNIATNTTNITKNANAISVLQTRTEANRITGETNTLAIEGLRNEIDIYHHYFQGYYEHTYLIEALQGERGDYAYNGETGTVWSFDTVWSDTLDPIPSDLAGKTQTTPLMDGTAAVGNENYYAAGDHRHPTDITRAAAADLTAHIDNVSNPHQVTKAQIGLGNVDNTADLDKPVSTAVQTLITNLQNQITALQAEVEALKSQVQTEVEEAEDIADEILGE